MQPYIEVVVQFLKSFQNKLVLCDLGCGDFNIGKQLVEFTKHYIAIDIVPELIDYNTTLFKADKLEFHCLDIAQEEWPPADLLIIRQVLQHLSNQEVQNVVNKLYQYKYVLITEHIPNTKFEANKDIISGQGIRLKKQSGLVILAPPFNLKIKEQKEMLIIPINNNKEVIVTTLYLMG